MPSGHRLFYGCLAAVALVTCSADTCFSYDGEVASHSVPSLDLPSSVPMDFGGNTYGVGGRVTTLTQCLTRDDFAGTFGWNWTRGSTTPACAANEACKAPDCFADFTLMSVGYGISPWGKDTGADNMPVNLDEIQTLAVSQDVAFDFTDDEPGHGPPETGEQDARRVRFIYDFFLTREQPNGTNIARSITDEFTINLAGNAHFPGSQPPGCLDPDSKYGNRSYGPIKRDAVWDGYHHYDYWYTDHHDAVPGTGSRYSAFRRVGAEDPGAQPPARVNLLPFVEAVRREWPGEKVGPWLGHIAWGTELYDHSSGAVTFHSPPTVEVTTGANGLFV